MNTYNADIITMSYGGWSAYHDGSDPMCQTADSCFADGIPVFMSTGNDADDDHHYSGTVSANEETGYIQINTNNNSALTFNLVWYDGTDVDNNLDLEFYNSSYSELTDVTDNEITESDRGTQSRYKNYNYLVSSGTYYLKVVNDSGNDQFFHIYFDDWGHEDVTFQNSDPYYTCGSPAEADDVFAVGAWTTDRNWTAYDGSGYYFSSQTNNEICDFSNRGPRIDGLQKPQITAPGSAIISLRDTDVYTSAGPLWVDDDGMTGDGTSDDHYYVMNGTSMSTPMCSGAAALFLDRYPTASPQDVYDALMDNAATDAYTGSVPNDTWGYGKLDIEAAIDENPLPVTLTNFAADFTSGDLFLYWETQTESNNLGWNIYRGEDSNAYQSEEVLKINAGLYPGAGTTNQPTQYEFEDIVQVAPELTYWYWIESISTSGTTQHYGPVSIKIPIEGEDPEPPQNIFRFGLFQNYPNPFNPNTQISFKLYRSQNVELSIFNIRGEKVDVVFEGFVPAQQTRIFNWDGTDANGEIVSSGIYLYRLVYGGEVETRKMILMK